MCVWPFLVRIEMMRHQAKSLPQDLPNLWYGPSPRASSFRVSGHFVTPALPKNVIFTSLFASSDVLCFRLDVRVLPLV